MFGVDSSEFFLVMLVALIVIGPKDMPKALRVVGKWVGKARAVAAQFRSGFDEMVREAEMDDLEKQWQAENERIMKMDVLEPEPEPLTLPDEIPTEPVTAKEKVTKAKKTPLVKKTIPRKAKKV
jgi:sec-independent protein translocase protein TatB